DPGGGGFSLPDLTLGVFLNDQPTHRFALGSDRCALIPLAKHQGWVVPAGGEGICEYDDPLDVMTISFDRRLLAEVGLERPDMIAPHLGQFDPLTVSLALGIEGFQNVGALHRETMSRALASQLVQSIVPTDQTVVDIEDRRLRRAIEFIEDKISNDMSLEELAQIAAMSPFHFARSFKAATGSSPLQYVINLRIDRARMLLKCTDLAISEIAHRVGYEDVSRFGRHFKSRVASTPGVYRKG
ncbi:MAG: AraC family transcriptional regulator, partial [Pseudomonadota bacterium]